VANEYTGRETTMPEEKVGVVKDYFAKISVAGIDITGRLKAGDTIHIKGHTTDFEQVVDSMQIEHEQVEEATAGQAVGIRVKDRVRHGDKVYKVT
jgi:translation initiation factor IF-2